MRYEGAGAMDRALGSSPTGEAFLVMNPDDSEVVFDNWAEAETYRHEPYRVAAPVVVKAPVSVEEQEARYRAQCERLRLAREAKKRYDMAPRPAQQEIHGEEAGQLQLVV